jgi:hypothetical protein
MTTASIIPKVNVTTSGTVAATIRTPYSLPIEHRFVGSEFPSRNVVGFPGSCPASRKYAPPVTIFYGEEP